ncbi:calcium-translocating P-type ATPase, PMCA-type [Desemzia sp. RIT804]|uniref:calcium-translocating P-type ATPase, PMCA-type n=1 Tax=Desemzia sp. RIT 804 TaxID=2810209 RepID=UPI00194FAA3E|nr:calcium-translocating P-type ATPase, PMCA-type [Desemzia sp. RIT 804]MBM6614749.1 calcium-translocating P-type ATPase, PMCA-type [Desemzia sp. RIT 804]
MNYKTEKLEEIAEELKGDLEKGLTAQQVEDNRKKYGANEFEESEKKTLFSRILEQLKEVMNLILLFAGFLSLYISFSDPSHGFSEPIVIFIIIFINMSISIYQEGKAEDALDSLKDLSSPVSKVIREGKEQEIDAAEVVQGDIFLLKAGDKVDADIRLIEANNLQLDEASLTGESVPVDKDPDADVEEDAATGDVLNTAFSGTVVTNGNGKGIVVGVGMDSAMGSIAELLGDTTKSKTPLQKRIDKLAKKLAVLAFIAGAIIFGLNYFTSDISVLDNLMTAVSLAIAAVPETLPVIVTLSLAYGVTNMVERNAIIRNMPAVETLGSASVIASDKTGTLTKNQMTIQKIWAVSHEPKDAEEEFNEDEEWLIKMMGLASNAQIKETEEEDKTISGDPTEAAIVNLLEKKEWPKEQIDKEYTRVFEIPFDSDRKRMTTIHEYDDKYVVITKGAFDRIPLDESHVESEHDQKASDIHDSFAQEALRIIGVSYKFMDSKPENPDADELEQDMTFAGIVGMIDPPREESKQAVKEAREAGIRPIMITGDHAVTATAIAKEIDIFREGDKTITGAEMEELSEEEINQQIEDFSVYARVSPEDKIRIVEAWQNKGEVVAMTGDGVNDAPSLQAADVGTAMGENGTEVAKNASDMILTDDNFATIVHAIEEGRRVYDNIKKTIYYLLSANVAEILIMLIAVLIGWGTPLTSIQLLFINVIADGIPGFGLSREKAESDIMKREPVSKNESIFANGGYRRISIAALTFTVISLIGFYVGEHIALSESIEPSTEVAQTLTFLILGWSSVIHIFVARTNSSIFKVGITENKTVFWTTVFSFVATTVVAAVPFLATIFNLVTLSWEYWLLTAVLSFMIIVVVEIEKLVLKKSGKSFLG